MSAGRRGETARRRDVVDFGAFIRASASTSAAPRGVLAVDLPQPFVIMTEIVVISIIFIIIFFFFSSSSSSADRRLASLAGLYTSCTYFRPAAES